MNSVNGVDCNAYVHMRLGSVVRSPKTPSRTQTPTQTRTLRTHLSHRSKCDWQTVRECILLVSLWPDPRLYSWIPRIPNSGMWMHCSWTKEEKMEN